MQLENRLSGKWPVGFSGCTLVSATIPIQLHQFRIGSIYGVSQRHVGVKLFQNLHNLRRNSVTDQRLFWTCMVYHNLSETPRPQQFGQTKCLGLASTYFWPVFVQPVTCDLRIHQDYIPDWAEALQHGRILLFFMWKNRENWESEKITLVSERENPWLLSNIIGLQGRSPADLGRGRGTSAEPCHVCLQFGESSDFVCWSLVKQGINCLTCVWPCVYVNVSKPK